MDNNWFQQALFGLGKKVEDLADEMHRSRSAVSRRLKAGNFDVCHVMAVAKVLEKPVGDVLAHLGLPGVFVEGDLPEGRRTLFALSAKLDAPNLSHVVTLAAALERNQSERQHKLENIGDKVQPEKNNNLTPLE